ncbi:Gfo/Idh/MocA family oxidoreductase [Rhodothermus profundi]|uniref:Predicted dehydrogenase n=1 Tax=Rhodothermus profundi TaxID=633813 RepID=A0A1M6TMM8_9BACT|nr:Gfo/Idh/MocA family oxidoreductase [Rhodothermus profundi]SHK58048.1 Predicted dehydrogenase [Rhodothermus profundi]
MDRPQATEPAPAFRIGLIGSGRAVHSLQTALRALKPMHAVARLSENTLELPDERLAAWMRTLDVVFIATPPAERFRVTEIALREGVHCFVAWPPAPALRDLERLNRLAEEARVEVGVSRPLRFHPALESVWEQTPPTLLVYRQQVGGQGVVPWHARLAEVVDLCCALAHSSSVLRIEGEAVRGGPTWLEAIAFGLRFHSGTYAQVLMWRNGETSTPELYLARTGWHRRLQLEAAGDDLIQAEVRAFLKALAARQPAPVSLLETLQVLRIVERLMSRLR